MSDAVFLQHVYSGSEYREGVRIGFERHFEYCAKHWMDYHLVEQDVRGWSPEQGAWGKVVLARELLKEYRYVFYVDADALVYDVDVDLRAAFEGTGAGVLCVRHPGPPVHLNVGVMFFRQGPRMDEFMGAWLDGWPGERPWWEQTVFNDVAGWKRFEGLAGRMDDRWNSTCGVNESREPVILGWHGGWEKKQKWAWMREALLC